MATSFFTPPRFDDGERTRRAGLLHWLLWFFIGASGIYLVTLPWLGMTQPGGVLLLIIAATAFVALLLNRRGAVQLAAALMVVALWGSFTFAYLFGGEPALILPGLYMLVILFVGLVAHWRAVVVTALVTLLAVVAVWLFDWTPTPLVDDIDPGRVRLVQVSVLALSAGIVVLFNRHITASLAAGRRLQTQLAQRSAELETTNTALRASETRYRTLIESAPEPILLIDVDRHRIISANARAHQLFGYTERALIGLNPDRLSATAEHVMQLRAALAHVDAAGGQVVDEWLCLNEFGKPVTTQLWLARVPDTDQRLVRAIVIDLTEQRRVASMLRDSQRRFELLVNHIDDVFWLSAPDGSELYYVSPAFDAIVGRSRQALLTDPGAWLDSVHPADRAAAAALFAARLEGGADSAESTTHLRIIRPDGTRRWLWSRSWPVFDENGASVANAGIMADITHQKDAERILQARTDLLRLITDNMPARVIYLDTEARVIFDNRRPASTTFTADATGTVPWHTAVDPAEHAAVAPFIEQALAGATVTFDYEDSADGRVVRYAGVPHIQDGVVVGLILLAQDVTEQHRAEAWQRRAQLTESLGLLAGGVAHDFSNLLVAILGQTALVQARLPADHPAQRHVTKALRAAEQAADLTQQMLAYSGRNRFNLHRLNLGRAVVDGWEALTALVPERVTLTHALGDGQAEIQADPAQIRQLLVNLVLNAVEAVGPNAGTITLTTGQERVMTETNRYGDITGKPLPPGDYVTLTVCDDGAGLDAATSDHMFDPFFSTRDGHAGLGLAVVLGIVRGHGGGLVVDSAPGAGTTLHLLFPAAARPVLVANGSLHAAPDADRLLLVYAAGGQLDAALPLLQTAGLGTLVAHSRDDALTLLAQHADAVRLVVVEEGGDSAETTAALEQAAPDARILLLPPDAAADAQSVAETIVTHCR